MKKIKILAPLLGISTIASAIVPIASCSCSTTQINKDDGIEKVELSKITLNQELTITITYKNGYKLKEIKVKVDGKDVDASKLTISADGKTVKVAGDAITSNKITITVTSQQSASSKITLSYTNSLNWAVWDASNPTEIDGTSKKVTVKFRATQTTEGIVWGYMTPNIRHLSWGTEVVEGTEYTHEFTWTEDGITAIRFDIGSE